ncbi:MAG: hypothetical protein IJD68_02620 [Ruminococcus sp.]|nr:hypothetical protein [Ruminococcus sp.]
MKRLLIALICLILTFTLCACNSTQETVDPIENIGETTSLNQGSQNEIVGTWICDDINEKCYFIFEDNGDAFAKWGTSTVYGYFDFEDETNLYDIDIPNFLYNEYKANIDGDEMTLESDESSYTFKKATMPEVTIKAPTKLKTDESLIGDWQSEDSPECYRFNKDGTAVITDVLNYATVDCKYSCSDNKVTLYYMVTEEQDGSRELEYSLKNNILALNGYEYEKVE